MYHYCTITEYFRDIGAIIINSWQTSAVFAVVSVYQLMLASNMVVY